MAWQFVGGTSGSGTSNGYTVSLSGTLTGGIASSPAAGDVVVVFTGFANNASSAPSVSGNTSGTYTTASGAQHVNDTWDSEFAAFYKQMGATPDTTLTITRATDTAYGGATAVQVWRGADPAVPFGGSAAPTSGGNGAALNPPAFDPAVAGSLIIAGGMGTMPAAGTAGYTAISGMSNTVTAYGNGSTADASVIMAAIEYAGSSYDPAVATGGTQNNTSSSWAGATVTLRVEVYRPSPGLLTRTKTLYAPTVVVPQVLAPGLVSPTKSLFAPSVSAAAASEVQVSWLSLKAPPPPGLFPPLLDSSAGLFAPVVAASAQALLPPLLSSSKSLFAPTAVAGSVTLLPALLTRGTSVFAPSVVPGSVSLVPTLVSRQAELFPPVLSAGGYTLQPPLLTRGASLFGPSLQTGSVSLAPPLVGEVPTLFPPAVSNGDFVQVSWLEFEVLSNLQLTPTLLTRTKSLFAPTVSLAGGQQTLLPGPLSRGSSLFAPAVQPGSVSLQPSVLTRTASLFAPSLAVGPATLIPQLLSSGRVILAPTLVPGAVALAPGLLARGASAFAPAVTPGAVSLSPLQLTRGKEAFPHSLAVGSVALQPPLLVRGATTLPPVVEVAGGPKNLLPSLLTHSPQIQLPSVQLAFLPEEPFEGGGAGWPVKQKKPFDFDVEVPKPPKAPRPVPPISLLKQALGRTVPAGEGLSLEALLPEPTVRTTPSTRPRLTAMQAALLDDD